ncbi:MAG: hypothetical protein WC836_07575 [Desulfobacula sp.]|jgi:hypothetical protein
MNLDTIKTIRDLKPKFPFHFGYLKEEGANLGTTIAWWQHTRLV